MRYSIVTTVDADQGLILAIGLKGQKLWSSLFLGAMPAVMEPGDIIWPGCTKMLTKACLDIGIRRCSILQPPDL